MLFLNMCSVHSRYFRKDSMPLLSDVELEKNVASDMSNFIVSTEICWEELHFSDRTNSIQVATLLVASLSCQIGKLLCCALTAGRITEILLAFLGFLDGYANRYGSSENRFKRSCYWL